ARRSLRGGLLGLGDPALEAVEGGAGRRVPALPFLVPSGAEGLGLVLLLIGHVEVMPPGGLSSCLDVRVCEADINAAAGCYLGHLALECIRAMNDQRSVPEALAGQRQGQEHCCFGSLLEPDPAFLIDDPTSILQIVDQGSILTALGPEVLESNRSGLLRVACG